MSLDEFLLVLREWGKWSRGGIPRYRCQLNRPSGAQAMIDPDTAQWIDACLCQVKRHLNTEAFELYYVGGWSVTAIAAHLSRYSRTVDEEITSVEKIIYVRFMERERETYGSKERDCG